MEINTFHRLVWIKLVIGVSFFALYQTQMLNFFKISKSSALVLFNYTKCHHNYYINITWSYAINHPETWKRMKTSVPYKIDKIYIYIYRTQSSIPFSNRVIDQKPLCTHTYIEWMYWNWCFFPNKNGVCKRHASSVGEST